MDRTRTVLLVEDDADDEALTLRALERGPVHGRVHVCRDGEEALEHLFGDRPPVLPDIVLLDLKMPKLDGFEVLRRIRADDRMRTMPVVVLTSSREETDLRHAYHLGANSYIQKPVDPEDFVATLHHLGRYWLGMNMVSA